MLQQEIKRIRGTTAKWELGKTYTGLMDLVTNAMHIRTIRIPVPD